MMPFAASAKSGKRWIVFGVSAILFLCALVLLLTRSNFMGDTFIYDSDIATYLTGKAPFSSLYDFGHLIWRPIGALLVVGRSPSMQVDFSRANAALVHVNLIGSLLCAFLLWALLRMTKLIKDGVALFMVAAFLTTNGFITLSRSGTSWLSGLACVLAGCCLTLMAERRHQAGEPARWIWIAALLAASLAILLWVPYVLAALPVVCSGLLVRPEKPQWKTVWRAVVRIVPGLVFLVAIAYLLAIHARHIASMPELRSWVVSAEHGELMTRRTIRFFFGLPRSFFILGNNGIVWKQYLFHDPYARRTLFDVLWAGSWILALFYGAAAMAGLFLVRARQFRGVLIWAILGVVPTVILAIAFESGSVERYFALYPMVFLVVGVLLASAKTPRPLRALLIGILAVQIGNNLFAAFRPKMDREFAASLHRVGPLVNRPGDVTLYVMGRKSDDLMDLYSIPEFAMSQNRLDFQPVAPSRPNVKPEWSTTFANSVLNRWARGGEAWASKRFWAARPRRGWLWVENDEPGVHWAVYSEVFSHLKTDAETDGKDGFLRIANTPDNQAQLRALAAR